MQAPLQPGFRKRGVAPVLYITMKAGFSTPAHPPFSDGVVVEPSSSLSRRSRLKSSAPPNYCSLLFDSRRTLSVIVTSAGEIFVHQIPDRSNSGPRGMLSPSFHTFVGLTGPEIEIVFWSVEWSTEFGHH